MNQYGDEKCIEIMLERIAEVQSVAGPGAFK
jgi:hypothetical protein